MEKEVQQTQPISGSKTLSKAEWEMFGRAWIGLHAWFWPQAWILANEAMPF